MAVDVLAPFADALIGVIAWIAEVFLRLCRSCVRSLRYAFSSAYREAVDEQFKGRGSLYRAAFRAWGVVAVAACIVLLGAIIYWALAPQPTPAEACAKIELERLANCARAIREALPK